MVYRKKSRFSISTDNAQPVERQRGNGPMSAAVKEAAESLTESTEAKVEARKLNARDAKAYRSAREDGLVIERVPLPDIATDDLPRDRMDLSAVEASDEMDELKSSISSFGQKEPIELYRDPKGALQLKKGWRRLAALRALYAETGEERFSVAFARVDAKQTPRLQHYVDMVEENVIREDLTFAEMAKVAISAASDPSVEGGDPEELVNRLYGSLHKMKRSHIRSFVKLLMFLGDDLKFPKAVARNVGLDLVRELADRQAELPELRKSLSGASDEPQQYDVIQRFLAGPKALSVPPGKPTGQGKRKFEFHLAETKVTARKGEIRLRSEVDYSEVPRDRLERAIQAFEAALKA